MKVYQLLSFCACYVAQCICSLRLSSFFCSFCCPSVLFCSDVPLWWQFPEEFCDQSHLSLFWSNYFTFFFLLWSAISSAPLVSFFSWLDSIYLSHLCFSIYFMSSLICLFFLLWGCTWFCSWFGFFFDLIWSIFVSSLLSFFCFWDTL